MDQFSEYAVFGILADPDEGPAGFWVVRDVEKVRPVAGPIEQAPTFDMDVLGPDGTVVDEIRLTIKEIEQVRASEPLVPCPEGDYGARIGR